MTRQQLESRIASLKVGLADLTANVHATEGAILECEHWLAQLDEEAGENPATPEVSGQ